MSLLRGESDHIRVPVKVELVIDGKDVDVEFIAIFNKLDKKKAREIGDYLQRMQIDLLVLTTENNDIDVSTAAGKKRKYSIVDEITAIGDALEKPIAENLIGWEDLTDSENNVLPYSEELKARVVNEPAYFEALQLAFAQATGKRGDVLAKN